MKTRVVRLMLITAVIAMMNDELGQLTTFVDGSGLVPVAPLVAQTSEPGFQVEAYNASIMLGLSDSDTYNLLLSPSGGFTGAVVCDVSGLPAGSVGTLTPPGGPPHPGPFALTVATDTTVQPGTYLPTVTCVNGTLSASKTLTLGITTDPDFRVIVEPNSLTLSQGQKGTASFEVKAMNGFGQGVTMSTTGLPPRTSAVFTPGSLIPTGAGTAQFIAGLQTSPGVYQIFVTATAMNGSLVRRAGFELTLARANTSGSWRQQAMGDTPAMFYGVVVGDVGNTGRNRVYASGGLGVMYEYAFDGAAWSFSRLPVGVQADAEMHNMEVGPARGDGINRLYIAVSGGDKVYECSWANSTWQCVIMATPVGATDVSIGDGRNDGRTRMYVTSMTGLTEYTWTGTAWSAITLSNNEGGWVHGIDLGPGRSDGINRVYTANQSNGEVYEYSWNGSAWTKLPIGTTSDSRNIEVGQGRNDGKYRVYVPSGDSNLYEFTWSGTAWQKVSIGSAGVPGVKVQGIPATARSDDWVRIYAASSDGGVDEYTWTGTGWQTLRLGRATAYMYGLAKGDGLNKGTTQIYGSSYDGQAYLFEWVPGTSDTQPPTAPAGLVATGSPSGASLTWSASTDNVGVTLYSIHRSPQAGFSVSAANRIGQSSTTSFTDAGLAPGTYYYRVTAQDAAVNVSGPSNEAAATVTGDTTPPTVTAITPASGATGIAPTSAVTATFSEAMDPATISANTFELRNPSNAVVAAIVTYDSNSRVATLRPNAALANSTAYTATVKGGAAGAKDLVGNPLVSDVAWSFTTAAPGAALAVDKVVSSDGAGTRTIAGFNTVAPGEVLVAFAASDGPTSGGQMLTVSGAGLTWTLVRRVNTQAGTSEIWRATASSVLTNASITSAPSLGNYDQSLTLVAFTGAGGTGASAGASASTGAPTVSLITTQAGSFVYGVGNDWDRAVARTVGANQVLVHQFLAPSGDTMWAQTRSGAITTAGTVVQINDTAPTTDRWNLAAVEILAGAPVADTTPPTVTGVTPANGATGVSTATTVTATFSEPIDTATIGTATFELRNPANTLVAATVTYNSATRTASLTPSAALAVGTTYIATVKGGGTDPRVKDSAGNALAANLSWSFTTVTDTTPPTVTGVMPANGAAGVSTATTVTATFSEPIDTATIGTNTFELRNAANAVVAATVTYNSSTRTATLAPSTTLTNGATYTATVRGGATDPRIKDVAGNALIATITWSFTTAAATGGNCPCSLWSATASPARIETSDSASVELGMRFRADVNGSITGLKFYKGSTTTGTHVGKLWNDTGTLLATVTFTNETASGWQQVTFASPVAITANTTYVVSYHTNVGNYAVTEQYFTTAVNNPPLRAPANGGGVANGVYRYGSSAFPNQTYNASNYWIDVIFIPSGQ